MKLLKNESGCRAVAEAKTVDEGRRTFTTTLMRARPDAQLQFAQACCASSRPITFSDICVRRRA